MSLQCILVTGLAILIAFILVLFVVQRLVTTPLPIIKRHEKERRYFDPISVNDAEFPSIEDEPTLDLSVIIPAFNEEKRLPIMLDECLKFLEEKSKQSSFTYEVIVVSDGSSDGTISVALQYSERHTTDKFRVMELIENRGKGGAVRLGILSARGRHLLFADADGATKFSDYEKLDDTLRDITKTWQEDAIVIGSRAHLEEEAIASRSLFRTFLMYGFHFLVWLFAVRSVRDTQCGFKLLTRPAARKAFDVELLYIAERLNIPIREVAVNWKEIEGSKLTPFWSWLQMGVDLFLIWFRYTIGAWRVDLKPHSN